MHVDRLKQLFVSATARLTISYLAIIMLMSIGFSSIFYNTSSRALDRQVPSSVFMQNRGFLEFSGARPVINQYILDRVVEGRHALLERLIAINALTLAAGSIVSYYLARRTLEPIERNMEAQTQFVSDASHELRTPLTALQTMNEVALRRAHISPEDARDIFQQTIEEVTKLKALTDSLLRLSSDSTVSAQLKPTPLQVIAGTAIAKVTPAAEAKHITIRQDITPATVQADAQSLSQALAIVLDNAVKYSPAKTSIQLKAFAKGGFGYLTIRDEGPGIAPADLPRIFDRFYRADQSRNKQQVDGHGIGLSLAKKILAQHDGDIAAQSKKGRGATFVIKVPLAAK